LKRELTRKCVSIPSPRDIAKARLPVDRAFSLRGVGMIVTGTLGGGKLRRGDRVVVQASGRTARIRALQNHGRDVETSEPGMRTALSIPGIEIARGDVVTRAELGQAGKFIGALIIRSARLPMNTRPLKHGAVVRVHHGTANYVARIFFANEQELRPGQSAIAELRFDAPIFAFIGDRFVLRDSAEQNTLAGARVLDDASTTAFRSAEQQQLLRARANAPDDPALFVRTQLQRDHAIHRASLLLKSHFSTDEIARATNQGKLAGEFICDGQWWNTMLARARSLVDAEHEAHPHRMGLELTRLRDSLAAELPAPELFDELVTDLCRSSFVRCNETLRRAAHRPSLPPSLRSAGSRIRAVLAAHPFDPPAKKELAPDTSSQEALRYFRDTSEIVEISADVVVSRDALEQIRRKVTAALRADGGATVSELRQLLGSSRRFVVPLLEYFDRFGVTRRVGDKRVLASPH
jgi:selenocysteine-specific elongation factor